MLDKDGFRFTIYRKGFLSDLGGNGWECRTSTWATRSYALFAETLHQLCHIGSAYKDNPNIVL